jgi:hypothetical protein
VLARTDLEESWNLLWGGAWFGLWIGIGASLAYGLFGGRRTGGAALAATLAALLVLAGLFSYAFVGSLGDDPFSETVLGALVVFVFIAVPYALLLLVGPAVLAAVSLGEAAKLVRHGVTRRPPRDPRGPTNTLAARL